MINESLKKYIGSPAITIVDAMEIIDRNTKGIIFIVDENDILLGSLTDGDIRRWIIKTGNLNAAVSQAMNYNLKYLLEGDSDQAEAYMRKFTVNAIPVVNERMELVQVAFLGEKVKSQDNQKLELIPVIIMAGGKGTRLYPYTKILPKPLIPIGEVPIIERIMRQFASYGAHEFHVTVNYKKGMIKAYLKEAHLPYDINYVEEEKPLGTAGSIRLIEKKFNNPIIISNCDVLIEADYSKIVEYHKNNQNDLTVVSSLKNVTIPYGVLSTSENGVVKSIEEKPHYSFLINTGMYVINPDIIDKIPENTFYHMTDLTDALLKENYKVGMYPISENSYLDMGQFEEMKRMEEIISHKGNENE